MFVASPAYANMYGSAQLGGVIVQDSDVTDSVPGASATGSAEFDTGWAFGAALGYAYPSGLRIEGELSYRRNDIDSVTVDSVMVGPDLFTGLGTFDVDGEVDSLAFMANLWYDFNAGGNTKPYIGGGLGIVRVGVDIDGVAGIATSYSDEDWVFGYQLGAGVGFQVASNTMLTIDYRFLGTSDPEFEDSGEKLEAEYLTHALMVGLRFGF